MKKTLLVAALVAGFAGMASASTVTLSGELKAEAKATLSTSLGNIGSVSGVGVGLTFVPSWEANFALSGSEDLSNGLKAIFELGAEVTKPEMDMEKVVAARVAANVNYQTAVKAAEDDKKEAYTAASGDAAQERAADKAYVEALAAAKTQYVTDMAAKVGSYGLEVTSAYVGLSGEFGKLTVGLQEDDIYTEDKLLSKELEVSPLVKYVGEFGDAKVALNVGDFRGAIGAGVVSNAAALVATGSFLPVSLSAEYSMSGVTGGLTLAVGPNADQVGVAAQLAYTYDKMLTVKAGYGYYFDVYPTLKAADPADPKSPTADEKAVMEGVATWNASRHHHTAFVAVGAKYALDDMSSVSGKVTLGYDYNRTLALGHAFTSELKLDYTYDMSKRTALGVSFKLVPPAVLKSSEKDSKFTFGSFSSELGLSLTHKF